MTRMCYHLLCQLEMVGSLHQRLHAGQHLLTGLDPILAVAVVPTNCHMGLRKKKRQRR